MVALVIGCLVYIGILRLLGVERKKYWLLILVDIIFGISLALWIPKESQRMAYFMVGMITGYIIYGLE